MEAEDIPPEELVVTGDAVVTIRRHPVAGLSEHAILWEWRIACTPAAFRCPRRPQAV
ncbi:hypothetical protein [Embleya scabrispora]|uniref:hypothetical protein n=1 Tax=Embleya scabrispora TaxID=159449 RepID=UPI00039E68F3|nr:hypothetical protein [Embleya scabrispora]MYS85068.1 hypothetical protein [Streptomyces sp. SID5474]